MTTADVMPSFLAPFPADRFFSEHWERAALVLHRRDPDYFRSVVDLDELDRLVTSVRIPTTNLNLAQGATPLPVSVYTFDGTFVDQQRMLALHQQGATIILRSIEQWSPGLKRLRIAAEQFFQFAAQVNVYLTPADEKSTPPHWDTHDLIILQVAGSKRWRLFTGQQTLPLADERFRIDVDRVSPEVEEIVLHTGDSLYLPRGVIHEPVAETYSAHVSIGIHVLRYYDLLAAALRLLAAREGSPLRRGLPRGCAGDPLPHDFDPAGDLRDSGLLEQAAGVLRRSVSDSVAVDLEGRLIEICDGPCLDAQAHYVRRAGTVLEALDAPTGFRVAAGDQSVELPRTLKDAVNYVNAHASFTADDLPGPHDRSARQAFCVALTQIGVLKIDG